MIFSGISFGFDHAGYELYSHLLTLCSEKNWPVFSESLHTYSLAKKDPIDYPDAVPPVVAHVHQGALGVLLCGSGIGMSIAANRFKGIRAALCTHTLMASLARKHNNGNILVMGARLTGVLLAKECLDVFATTPFEGGRHQERLHLLDPE